MALADYYRQYNSDVRLQGQFSGVLRGDYVRADILRGLDAKSKRGFATAKKFTQLNLDDSFRGLDVINVISAESSIVRRGPKTPSSIEIRIDAPLPYVNTCPVNNGDYSDPEVILSPSLDREPGASWVFDVFKSRPWLGWSSNAGEVRWPNVEPIEFTPPSVAIVIPIFNKPDRFMDCLQSVLEETVYPKLLNVYLVNDGSDEYSSSLINGTAKDNGWEVIEHENIGYLKSVNKGIKKAFYDGADYVVSMNSDIIVTTGWLSGMVRGGDKK